MDSFFQRWLVSIQPLLLFIWESVPMDGRKPMFQYNPCYCLSVSKVPKDAWVQRFNTTLVTVYRVSRIFLR